jgi:uncharacterized SAM-binding protein YcdF (DUF218 family)
MTVARFRRLLITALTAIGFVVLVVVLTPIDYWYATFLSGEWNVAQGDILIVLSASAGPSRLLSGDSYLRASYAVLAWREAHFRKILVCGRDAGSLMRDFIVFSGVPAEVVSVEPNSVSTHENAIFAAQLLRDEKGTRMLLTSDYHMYRALAAFRKAGLNVKPFPIPDVRKYSNGYFNRVPIAIDLLEETGKIFYYRWKGWT